MGILTVQVLTFPHQANPALNQFVSCSRDLLTVDKGEPVLLLEENVLILL